MALKPCIECKREISTEAKTCPHCGKKNPTTSPTEIAQGCAGCLVVLVILAIIGMCAGGPDSRSSASSNSSSSYTPPPPSPKRVAMAATSLDFTWSKGGFESVMIANFRISNKSEYTIKDIEITCTHSANSGTVIDSNTRTLYEIVKPGQTRRFPEINMGLIHSQASRSSCRISDLVAY